jgi:transcriptional regulator GlxA family with amidase domain
LEDTNELLEQVAAKTGFGSADRMRRAFLRNLGVNPSNYRERFHPDSAVAPAALQFTLHGNNRGARS